MGIEFQIMQPVQLVAHYIEVHAGVRYWEDANVNGKEDADGTLIPCRDGGDWKPVINIENGRVEDWPDGTEASVHYKVCDDGEYWLLDANKNRIAKYRSDYVPDLLSPMDQSFGDYIIMNIGSDGIIDGWNKPWIEGDEWAPVANQQGETE